MENNLALNFDNFSIVSEASNAQVIFAEKPLMVKICENFAKATKLKFRKNIRTKCLIFSKERVSYNEITPILLNELALPFVNDLKHLGNVLKSDNSMTIDCIPLTKNFILTVQMLF